MKQKEHGNGVLVTSPTGSQGPILNFRVLPAVVKQLLLKLHKLTISAEAKKCSCINGKKEFKSRSIID